MKSKKGKKKKPKPYPNPQLIKGALRRLMARSPIVREVREKAVHPTKKGPRGGKQYKCSVCKKAFAGNKIQVDHKVPVIPLNKNIGDLSYDELVKRIFCKKSNLQVLCLDCHKEKSKEERAKRKLFKDKRKYKNE